MDNKIQPIETFVKDGLRQYFAKLFKAPLIYTNVTGKRAALTDRLQGRPLEYPFAFASLTALSVPTDRYRAQPLLRRGLVGQATSDNLQTFKLPLIPMDFNYQIQMVTNDFRQAELYGKYWLMAAISGQATFDILYGVANIGIRVNFEPTVNFNERDSSPDAIEEHEVVTSLIVQGFGSHDSFILQQAANSVEINGQLVEASEKALQQEGSPGQVEVFRFKKEWPAGNGPLTS